MSSAWVLQEPLQRWHASVDKPLFGRASDDVLGCGGRQSAAASGQPVVAGLVPAAASTDAAMTRRPLGRAVRGRLSRAFRWARGRSGLRALHELLRSGHQGGAQPSRQAASHE